MKPNIKIRERLFFGKKVHVIYFHVKDKHLFGKLGRETRDSDRFINALLRTTFFRQESSCYLRPCKHKHLFKITFPHHSMWYSFVCFKKCMKCDSKTTHH